MFVTVALPAVFKVRAEVVVTMGPIVPFPEVNDIDEVPATLPVVADTAPAPLAVNDTIVPLTTFAPSAIKPLLPDENKERPPPEVNAVEAVIELSFVSARLPDVDAPCETVIGPAPLLAT